MSLTVILAVGVDSSLLECQISAWRSADFIVTPVVSVKDAIVHFKNGDFDIVLLGHSIPADSRERLTFLIRASGSRVPVIYISAASGDCDSFADATIKDEPTKILEEIGRLTTNRARMTAPRKAIPYAGMSQATAR